MNSQGTGRGFFLAQLSARFTAEDMRKMNYAVDAEKKDAGEVVRQFLRRQRLQA